MTTTTITTTSTSTPISSSDASWQEVGYRCPRPGFFLGDDGSMASSHILAVPSTSPSWSLGALGQLPLELLHQIVAELGELDIRALVALRNCNRATAAVVDGLRDFATVASFPRALGALVALAPPSSSDVTGSLYPPPSSSDAVTGLLSPPPSSSDATGPSLSALAACLRTTDCASCADSYGDFIYLLRPERICYACFRAKPAYLPVARFAGRPASVWGTGARTTTATTATTATTSIRVPPGRYGVLARLTQPVDLFDRRHIESQQQPQPRPQPLQEPAPTKSAGTSRPRPHPLRYAAVIPGPYWQASPSTRVEDGELDRGFACRACCQTDRSCAGWADPLVRYTAQGLQRHVADAQFGGRVIRSMDARTGAVVFAHDAPRRGHFPPPVEFGATADLARRYEAVTFVDESVARPQ